MSRATGPRDHTEELLRRADGDESAVRELLADLREAVKEMEPMVGPLPEEDQRLVEALAESGGDRDA